MSKAKVIVFGDKAKCSACKSFAKIEANVAGMFGDKGIGYEFLDYGTNPKGYAAGKKLVGKALIPKYPALFVLNGSKVVGSFVARSMTAAMIVKKVTALCVDCSEPTDEPTLYKECPTCKGAGKIAIALACLFTLFSAGCTGTKVSVTQVGDWSVSRLSILQKTEVPKITVKGVGVMDGYSNSGDVAMMQAMFEAAIKAAAKGSTAAVAP